MTLLVVTEARGKRVIRARMPDENMEGAVELACGLVRHNKLKCFITLETKDKQRLILKKVKLNWRGKIKVS